MDYILFGIGTGASLAVIGWIIRGWGPRLRDREPGDGEVLGARDLINRMSWSRFCTSCGMALIIGGTLLLLVTGIVALWNPGDTRSNQIMFGLYLLVALLMLIWAGLYTRQFGTTGIYRPIDPATRLAREAQKAKSKPAPVSVVEEVVVSQEPTEDVSAKEEGEAAAIEDTPEILVPDRPIEQVAAQRGGLGRFGAFFSREKPEPTSTELDESLELVDEGTDSTTPPSDDAAEDSSAVSDAIDPVADAEPSSGSDEEPSPASDEDHSSASEDDPTDIQNGDSLADSQDDDSLNDARDDESLSTNIGEGSLDPIPKSEATPSTALEAIVASSEEEALAALRRRRLARLSGPSNEPS